MAIKAAFMMSVWQMTQLLLKRCNSFDDDDDLYVEVNWFEWVQHKFRIEGFAKMYFTNEIQSNFHQKLHITPISAIKALKHSLK